MIAATAVVVVVALGLPTLERGDTCTLKSPLPISMRTKAGLVDTTLDKGTDIEVVGVSDGGSARIRAGDVKGDVSSADLEGACSGTLRRCTLKSPVMMYEQNRSDSKSWRIKEGATVSVLKQGKTWAAVRVEDLRGFVKSDEIRGACNAQSGSAALDGDGSDGGDGDSARPSDEVVSVEEVERGEGPGVLFLPFALEGAAPAGNADQLLSTLYDRGAYYRPDAARLPVEGSRAVEWKALVTTAARRARGADVAFVIVGRLAMEAPKPEAPLVERHLLQLGVVDAKTGNVLKAVRIRPTLDIRDVWADKALASLLPSIPAAPNSKLPVIGAEGFEVAPNSAASTSTSSAAANPPPPRHAADDDAGEPSALANPWGWLALGGAVALGAGSGVAGYLALAENARANETSAANPAHATARNTALAEAVTSDALAIAAVGVGVAGVIVFATRAGLD